MGGGHEVVRNASASFTRASLEAQDTPRDGTPVATQGPSNPQLKVIFGRFRQLLAINAHKMAPRPPQGLQDRPWDAPTKGLLQVVLREPTELERSAAS